MPITYIDPETNVPEIFPDDAKPSEIAKALGQTFPGDAKEYEISKALNLQTQMTPGFFGGKAVLGLAGLVGLPGNVANAAKALYENTGAALTYPIAKMAGIAPPAFHSPNDYAGEGLPIDSTSIMRDAQNLGLVNPGVNNTQGTIPQILGGVTEAVSGGLPLAAMTGGLSSIPAAIKTAYGLATSGAGGAIGQQLMPNHPVIGNILGSLGGSAVPIATEAGVNKFAGLPMNTTISPEMAQRQQTNIDNGINPSVYQFFPNLKRSVTQQQQINSTLGRTIGEETPVLTQDVLNRAADRIGSNFDDAAARTGNIALGPDYVSKINDIAKRITQAGISDTDEGTINRVLSQLRPPTAGTNPAISGQVYQQLTQRNGPISDLIRNTNSTVSGFGSELRSALDDALQASAPSDVVNQLTTARQQYKNLLMLQNVPDELGNVNPGKLSAARVSRYYPTYGRGGAGDIGDTIQGLQALKTPETPPNNKIFGIPTSSLSAGAIGAAGIAGADELLHGGLGALYTDHPYATVAGATGLGLTAGGNYLSKAITNSDWYKSQLIKQALGQAQPYNPLVTGAIASGVTQ